MSTLQEQITRTGLDAAGDAVAGAIEEGSNFLGLEQGVAGTFRSVIFPSSLNSEEGIRPVVKFKCIGGKGHKKGTIVLPAPSSFAAADTAQYGDTELGFGAKLAMDLTRSATSSEGRAELQSQFTDTASKGIDAFKGIFSGDNQKGNLLDLGKKLAPGATLAVGASLQDSTAFGGIGKGIAMAIGATFNKNVTTEFTSVSTRSFSFTYELVPSTQDEGKDIHNMITSFREAVYPAEANRGAILRYPPKWKVKFRTTPGGDSKRLRSFPALAECYLVSFSTTYNGNNSFHTDGRPVKTDIQLSFQEDRSLTLDDIKELEEKGEISS